MQQDLFSTTATQDAPDARNLLSLLGQLLANLKPLVDEFPPIRRASEQVAADRELLATLSKQIPALMARLPQPLPKRHSLQMPLLTAGLTVFLLLLGLTLLRPSALLLPRDQAIFLLGLRTARALEHAQPADRKTIERLLANSPAN